MKNSKKHRLWVKIRPFAAMVILSVVAISILLKTDIRGSRYKEETPIEEETNVTQTSKSSTSVENESIPMAMARSVSANTLEFSEEEQEYIKQAKKIKVALYPNRNILSTYDEETKEFSGIAYNLMRKIEEESGLKFEYIVMPLGVRGVDFFREEGSDIIAPVLKNEYVNMSPQVECISLKVSTELVIVGRKNENFTTKAAFTMIFSESFFHNDDLMTERFPNAEYVYADEGSDCFNSIIKGEADVTYENYLVAMYRLRSPYYKDTLEVYEDGRVKEEMLMMLSKDADPVLKSILSKTVDAISEHEVNSVVVDQTASTVYKYSLSEIIYQYRYQIVIVILGITMVVCMIVYMSVLMRKEREEQEENTRLTERRKADEKYQKQLYRQINFDSMTGMLNRNGFYEKTTKLIADNKDIKFVIVRGDIDKFKAFNDIMGTKVGDELIRYVAEKWKEYFQGQVATYAYLGRDDFVCCIPYRIFDAEKMMETIQGWLQAYSSDYALTLSMGAYVIEDINVDVNIMCDRAELALEKSRKSQKVDFTMYDESMRESIIKVQEIINYIPTAIEKEQFEVYLQPQYDSHTKKVIGAEALVRWNHPEQGIVTPDVFIPIMEQNGMITKLDLYVVEHVCRILRMMDKNKNLPEDFSIAINISRIDTCSNVVIDKIMDIMNRHKVSVSKVRLEITESVYVEQNEQMSGFVNELRKKGFCVEMDDFGNGYSSLNALKDIAIDTLKLDLKFLEGAQSLKGRIIINSVIEMAKRMKLPVIAEGVETQEQAEFLENVGCDYMQGFYFARPLRVDDFMKLVGSKI